jgi:hypothetical protein
MSLLKNISNDFSFYNRKKKLKFVKKYIQKNQIESCLIVGASPKNSKDNFVNLIEEGILKICSEVTISGIATDGGGWENWITADGRKLPFDEKSFDLVFSNAVIEHVGIQEDQRKFINEHERVGKFWMLTTPNRHFPVESHSYVLFKHMSGAWVPKYVSRLLSKRDLREIIPSTGEIKGHFYSPTFICYKTD